MFSESEHSIATNLNKSHRDNGKLVHGNFMERNVLRMPALQKCLQSKYRARRAVQTADSSGSHVCPRDITSES